MLVALIRSGIVADSPIEIFISASRIYCHHLIGAYVKGTFMLTGLPDELVNDSPETTYRLCYFLMGVGWVVLTLGLQLKLILQ